MPNYPEPGNLANANGVADAAALKQQGFNGL